MSLHDGGRTGSREEARCSPEEGAGDATPLGTMSPRDGDEEGTQTDLSQTMALLMLWL